MRRFLSVPAFGFAFVGFSALASLVAPESTRSAGLDFWNHAAECALLRDQADHRQDLEFEQQQILKRDVLCNQIALGLCDGRMTLSEAADSMAVLAESDPRWFASVRCQYRFTKDWDVITHLLRLRMELILKRAERAGDPERAALISARLICFEEEVRGVPLPGPHTAGIGK